MVYDAVGRLVSTLVDGRVDAGRHTVEWNATNGQGDQVSPGIYFISMEAGSYRATKKVVMVR
jgi:flagellar hook assembly protein FlgD